MRWEWVKKILLGLGVAAAAGCGLDDSQIPSEGQSPGPSPTEPAGPTGDGTPVIPTPQADGTCHSLDPNGAPLVTDQFGSSLPSLEGGPLVDGTYTLVQYDWYSPKATLHSRKILMSLSGGGQVAQYVWLRDQDPTERVTAYVATEGARIAFRGACPSGRDLEWDRYHASGDTLVVFSTRDSKSATFRRQ